MKLLVAGGRDFNDDDLMHYWLGKYYDRFEHDLIIIHGMARGADSMASRWAEWRGVDQEGYPAQWDKYGKSAGFRRNEEMWEVANMGIIFWDGQSRGTAHSLELAAKHRKYLQVVKY